MRMRARLAAVAAVLAALCYSSFLLSRWTHAAATVSGGFVSELEAPGQPFAWLYRGSDVVAGLGMLVAAWGLRATLGGGARTTRALGLLVLTGLASIADGATTMRCDPGTDLRCAAGEQSVHGLLGQVSSLHTDTGLVGFAASAAGAILLGAVVEPRWPARGRLQIVIGAAIGACGLADVVLLLAGVDIGDVERVRIVLTSAWLVVLAGVLLTRRRRDPSAGAGASTGERTVGG